MNSIQEHLDLIFRTSLISLFSGLIGGSAAFLIDPRWRDLDGRGRVFIFYCYKIGVGFFSAYLAILSVKVFGIDVTAQSEQVISILAAVLGSDFIIILTKRVLNIKNAPEKSNEYSKYDYNREYDERESMSKRGYYD